MRTAVFCSLSVLMLAVFSIQVDGFVVLLSVIPLREQRDIALLFIVFIFMLAFLAHRIGRWPVRPWLAVLSLAFTGAIAAWGLQVLEFFFYTRRGDIQWTFNPFEDEFRRSVYFVFPALLAGGALSRLPWKVAAAVFGGISALGAWLAFSRIDRSDPPGFPPVAKTGDGHPNVILVLVDDVGYFDLSAYGNPLVSTPHIDRIGREGVQFATGYCAAPVCAPSRASLLTGRYAQRYGFEGLTDPLPFIFRYRDANFKDAPNGDHVEPQVPWWKQTPLSVRGLPVSETTVAELLKAKGYATALFGKWHGGVHPNFSPLKHGFDTFLGFKAAGSLYADRKDTAVVTRPPTDTRIDKITNQLYNYYLFDGDKMLLNAPRVYQTDLFTDKSLEFIEANKDKRFFLFLSYGAAHAPMQAKKVHYDRLAHIRDPDQRAFYAMICAADEGVGKILDKLEALGLEENTLVIFTSDNGGATYLEINNSGKLRGGKFSHFEGGLRVPFMMRWPGKMPEKISDARPVSHLDILPTIAAATGADCSGLALDGINLLPLLDDTTAPTHGALYFRNRYSKAVRAGDLKLYVNEKNAVAYLFDLSKDPAETHDLSEAMPMEKRRLQQMLATWEKGLMPPRWRQSTNFAIWGGDKYYFFGE